MNFTDTTVSPGPTQTGFFENVGTEVLTSDRQTSAEVVRTAPTVVPGLTNKIMAGSARFVPRPMMARMSWRMVKPAA